jgi:hypothetical protein
MFSRRTKGLVRTFHILESKLYTGALARSHRQGVEVRSQLTVRNQF